MCITDLADVASVVAQGGPDGTIVPPIPYNVLWAVLGVILVVIVATYYLFAWLLTRPSPEPSAPVSVPSPRRTVPELQGAYLYEVDQIAHRYAAGELTPRRAHAALSVAVREFLAEATGVPTDKMTLTELRSTPFVGATHAVAEFYPIVFGADEAHSVEHGTDAARQVIMLWR